MSIIWRTLPFPSLTTTELYHLLKLRTDVFVVEQNCPYPELDNKDLVENVHHLVGYKDGRIVACARLLPKGVSYKSVSIGRVATHEMERGSGVGHELLKQALKSCQKLWPGSDIEIGAQEHLKHFYAQYGFTVTSEMYLEDGIPHVDMKFSFE